MEVKSPTPDYDYMHVGLPELYPWVLFTAGLISFEVLLIGFWSGCHRPTLFNKEFMTKNFGDAHKKAFGTRETLPQGGYPDHGNGFYGDKLSYKDWFEFAVAQRTHKNALEQVTIVVFAMMVTGVRFPLPTIIIGALHLIGRIVFTVGYIQASGSGSNKGRVWGTIMCIITTFVLLAMGLLVAWQYTQLFERSGRAT